MGSRHVGCSAWQGQQRGETEGAGAWGAGGGAKSMQVVAGGEKRTLVGSMRLRNTGDWGAERGWALAAGPRVSLTWTLVRKGLESVALFGAGRRGAGCDKGGVAHLELEEELGVLAVPAEAADAADAGHRQLADDLATGQLAQLQHTACVAEVAAGRQQGRGRGRGGVVGSWPVTAPDASLSTHRKQQGRTLAKGLVCGAMRGGLVCGAMRGGLVCGAIRGGLVCGAMRGGLVCGAMRG
eukprot:350521-Chlamydomonas_euryale.AAC.1